MGPSGARPDWEPPPWSGENVSNAVVNYLSKRSNNKVSWCKTLDNVQKNHPKMVNLRESRSLTPKDLSMAEANGEEDVVVQWQHDSPDDGDPWMASSLKDGATKKVNSQANELFGELNNLPFEQFVCLNRHLERAAGTTIFHDQVNHNSQTNIEPVVLNEDNNLSPPPSDEHSTQSHTSATMNFMLNDGSVATVPPISAQMEEPTVINPFCANSSQKSKTKCHWPSDLMRAIKSVLLVECPCPTEPEFVFSLDKEAAERNMCVLNKYGKNLVRAIEAQSKSPLGYGSEFRSIKALEPLFDRHPNWPRMKSILKSGSDWPLDDLSPKMKLRDLREAKTFGNHKGAESDPVLLRNLIEGDVIHGYALVLPLDKIDRIPGVLLAPMNIMKQNTIDEYGSIIEKDRLTHDQSYIWGSETSVNSRVRKDELLPCMFGYCLRRLMNWAVAARIKYPGKRILASKIDYKSAYRRCHLNAKTAIQTCTQLPEDNLALVTLRLTFGGAPCPFEWGVFSETICDLSQTIMQCEEWNPTELQSPLGKSVPPVKYLQDEIPFAKGRALIVDIPVNPKGNTDVYIDDTIALTVDMEGSDNVQRLEQGTLLAVHAASRELHPNEPIARKEMAAMAKLTAEAGAEETKTILGWF